MADYLNIAGRVRTTASDGVAMEAQEVKDLNQNKSQQQINADVQTELGDRYTKEETYSKEQLDELITTPDVTHVSVVATNATTAADIPTLINASGEGEQANTIYRVGNWNGTQYDPTMYALFAWNGTTYVCIAVRSFVGEVYDISVNHPDGQGNPTPYADLAAALGTSGANIPADIRRGGMSIKFIQGTAQSSDNKYVQYRLMADTFNTTVANWQGVDDVPTAESENLVKSGGVSSKLLNNFFVGKGTSISHTQIDGLIPGNSYRVFTYRQTWPIADGSAGYIFNVEKSADGINWTTIVGVQKTAIEPFPTIQKYYDFVVPADAPYIRIGGRATNEVYVKFIIEDITASVEEDNNRMKAMYDTLPLKDIVPSIFVGKVEEVIESSSAFLFDNNFYPVASGGKVYVRHANDIPVRIISYDKDLVYLSRTSFSYNYEFTANANAKFIRICADYSSRGYNDNNPVTVNDYQNSDFGVYTSLVKVDDSVFAPIINGQSKNYLENTALRSNGDKFSYSGWCVFKEKIPCSGGDIILWNPCNTSSAVNIVFFNSSDEKIGNFSANVITRTVTAPTNSNYLKCSFKTVDALGNYNKHPLYINGIEYKRTEKIYPLNSLGDNVDLLDSLNSRRLSYKYMEPDFGCYYIPAGEISISREDQRNHLGWTVSEDYIPVKEGDTIVWNFGKYTNSSQNLIFYNESKEKISNYAANDPNTGTRTITAPANAKYVRISFYKTYNNKPNTNPISVNGVAYVLDTVSKLLSHDNEMFPVDDNHGIIGENYPEQIKDIENILNHDRLSSFHRLHILHVSDNHNSGFGNAQDFLDYSPAKFLINTGDMVYDKFTDGAAATIALAIAPTKPVYLVLGNHDVSHATSNQAIFDTFYGDSETEGTVNHHNSVAGGVVAEKTYYKVDYATEKVRCIMLDMNDGWSDAELPDLGPSNPGSTSGKMSQTQINWFVAQLQDAITNNYHVVVFIHTLPYNVDLWKREDKFCDVGSNAGLGVNSSLTFLPKIVDAFITGGSVSFDYNGNSYSFTFASAGHFVSWICGHTHYDMGGWMEGHTNQFMVNVCQPWNGNGAAYLGSYDGDRLGVHFNLYTIDTNVKSFSVYRVGQQETIFATERKSYRIIYK